jgi:uncharacterized membrane protein YjgN (DUF898 family)
MSNLPYYVSIGLCSVLGITVISTFATLVPKDSSQNSKLLAIVSVFCFAASIVAYGIALFHFSHNPGQMIQFILMVTMLVVLPASLISVAMSTVTISNLRDSLGNS